LVNGRTELASPKLARVIAPCDRIVVFVVTLGSGIDELVDDAMRRRPHVGLMIDTAASIAAEGQADRLTRLLDARLDPGLGLTLRYSPGYCDWPLREQEKLFDLLPERPAGTTLSTDFLMTPRKSVSGVIGIGPRRAVAETGCACKHCSRKDCVNRRS
jgi:cobalamin-dependent methionine synthase I